MSLNSKIIDLWSAVSDLLLFSLSSEDEEVRKAIESRYEKELVEILDLSKLQILPFRSCTEESKLLAMIRHIQSLTEDIEDFLYEEVLNSKVEADGGD